MPVFVELTTDAFANNFNKVRDTARQARRAGTNHARRPLRGLEIKDDTYAVLKVIQSDGTPIQLLDSGTEDGTTDSLTNFILQSVQEARMEKHQIVETFGEPYIFFFGESPRFLDVTAILVDSFDFNWYAEFWENYNRYLRGTRSVEMGARTYLFYDDNIVEGYMLMAQARKTSDTPLMVQLTFRLFLTNYSNVTIADGPAANPAFPVRPSFPASYIPPDFTVPAPDPFAIPAPPMGSPPGTGFIYGNKDEFTDTADGNPNPAPPYIPPFPLSRVLNAITLGAEFLAEQGGPGIVNGIPVPNIPIGIPGPGFVTSSTPGSITIPAGSLAQLGVSGAAGIPGVGTVTGSIGSTDPTTPASPYLDEESDTAGQPDATNLSAALVQQLAAYGADVNDPATFALLGLSPRFTTPSGFGVFGAAGSSASFGVTGTGSFGANFYGGINGGLGFVGQFNSSVSVAQAAPPSVVSNTPPMTSVFGNGIPVQSSIVSGTGVGGGIPGGLSGGIGPGGPGTLPNYTGGLLFQAPDTFSSSAGYGGGIASNGAAINVGGTPTLFSLIVASGDLVPDGSIEAGYFVGPDGSFSYTNTTGIFV
jgi:hypothetical protein